VTFDRFERRAAAETSIAMALRNARRGTRRSNGIKRGEETTGHAREIKSDFRVAPTSSKLGERKREREGKRRHRSPLLRFLFSIADECARALITCTDTQRKEALRKQPVWSLLTLARCIPSPPALVSRAIFHSANLRFLDSPRKSRLASRPS